MIRPNFDEFEYDKYDPHSIGGIPRQERTKDGRNAARNKKPIGPCHNSKAHYSAKKSFKEEYGREPTEEERREYHKAETREHNQSLVPLAEKSQSYTPIQMHDPIEELFTQARLEELLANKSFTIPWDKLPAIAGKMKIRRGFCCGSNAINYVPLSKGESNN